MYRKLTFTATTVTFGVSVLTLDSLQCSVPNFVKISEWDWPLRGSFITKVKYFVVFDPRWWIRHLGC